MNPLKEHLKNKNKNKDKFIAYKYLEECNLNDNYNWFYLMHLINIEKKKYNSKCFLIAYQSL